MKSIIKGRLYKLVLVFAVLGLLMQPVGQVLAAETIDSAQETLATTGPTAPESVLAEPIESETEPAPSEEEPSSEESETEPEQLAEEDEQETSPDGIPTPPVNPTVELTPSTVKQKIADADVASGALVYGYQMQLPKGRGGAQPNLGLTYNSQQNDEGSLVGHGWSLDLPAIERKNINGLNKMYTQEDFTSTMSGDLKKVSTHSGLSNFGARVDNGSFLSYSFNSSANDGAGEWTVKDKFGTAYTFGSEAESRLSRPTEPEKVFRWHLTRMQDSKGNFVSYEYVKVDHQVYPSVIKYTGHGNDDGIFKVEFSLEDRPDKAMSAKYGYMITNTKRVSEVRILIHSTVVGKYSLPYGQQSVNGRSQLMGVEYVGYDSSGENGISDGGMDFAYESIAATDLLTKIVQNTGGVTQVTYKSSAQFRDGAGAALNPNLPFAVQTVEKIEYDDRNGVTWENSFQYSGGWFYYNGPMDRRFVGFEKVSRTDSVGSTVTSFYHQGNGANESYFEPADDWAKAGKSYKSELRDSEGNLFTQVLNQWDFVRLSGAESADARSFAKLAASVTRTFDGDSTHRDKAGAYVYDDENGNLISGIDYGEVEATDTGTFVDVGTDLLSTTVTYAEPTTDESIIGLASGFIEKDHSDVKVKEGKIYFDGLALGLVGVGNATKEESWISGTTYSAVNRTYSSMGLPLTETDALNNTTTYSYDSFSLYPVSVTNALSQATSFEYDYRIGKPAWTLDPNGLVNKISYDGLGRAVKEEFTKTGQSDPNELFTKKAVSYELYEQGGEVRGWKTVETNYLDEENASAPRENKAITYTDGFDRPVQTRVLVESADASPHEPRYSVSDTVYNNISQIEKTSLPYFGSGSERTNIASEEYLFVTLGYDVAHRVVSTSNAVGVSTSEYDDWKVTVTDANGSVKALYKDAFDRLVKVDEHNGSEVYETQYSYDAIGNLVKIVDALGNERSFSYDGLGRRTQAEDLHAPRDLTFGVWNYSYDLVGNLTERVDAKGQVVAYNYDALNRLVSEDFNDDATLEVVNGYDSCVNGIGRLCSVVSSEFASANEYSKLGQVVKETKTIQSEQFVTEYSYDRQGKTILQTNPDLSQVKYEYNIGGAIELVKTKESTASNFSSVVNDIDYAPNGSVAYVSYGNGTTSTSEYDPEQMYRLVNKKTASVSSPRGQYLQDLYYNYDAVGNIASMADGSVLETARQVMYSYDSLHRILSSTVIYNNSSDVIVQTFEYDAIGNITYKSDVGNFTYGGGSNGYANPHAVTEIRGTGENMFFEYDANGNVVSSNGTEYTWDYNNRISELMLDGASVPIYYQYEPSGTRTAVVTEDATTKYPNKFYNTDGAVAQKHIFAGDGVNATIKGTGASATLTVSHSDHLGSTAVVTDSNAEVEELLDYHPFGEISFNSQNTDHPEQRKYTGHEYDVDTGLNYMKARYYNPSIGRFLSQDPVYLAIGDQNSVKEKTQQELQEILSDPQLLNSYSYARNNPLAYVDENGEWPSWSQIKTGVQAGWNLVKPFVQNKVNQVQNSWNSYNAYMKTPEAQQKSKAASLQGTVYAGPIAGIDRYVGFGVGSINSVGSGVSLNSSGALHIQRYHTLSGEAQSLNKSYFFNDVDYKGIITKYGNEAKGAIQGNGNIQRILDMGRQVGWDSTTGGSTSFMTIITDKAGSVITSHPGLPKTIKAIVKTIKK